MNGYGWQWEPAIAVALTWISGNLKCSTSGDFVKDVLDRSLFVSSSIYNICFETFRERNIPTRCVIYLLFQLFAEALNCLPVFAHGGQISYI
jgi:hypothetical protein